MSDSKPNGDKKSTIEKKGGVLEKKGASSEKKSEVSEVVAVKEDDMKNDKVVQHTGGMEKVDVIIEAKL